jgi:hypothetical protein
MIHLFSFSVCHKQLKVFVLSFFTSHLIEKFVVTINDKKLANYSLVTFVHLYSRCHDFSAGPHKPPITSCLHSSRGYLVCVWRLCWQLLYFLGGKVGPHVSFHFRIVIEEMWACNSFWQLGDSNSLIPAYDYKIKWYCTSLQNRGGHHYFFSSQQNFIPLDLSKST